MNTILKPFALCAAIMIPTASAAEELTADDYPDPRAATVAEVAEFCSAENNPTEEAQLLSYNKGEEYPFEIIFCQPPHVSPYKCSTLENLINFEFEIRSLFRESGRPLEGDDNVVDQFTGLNEVYDTYCQPLIF